MKLVRRGIREFFSLPRLMQLGLVILALGGGLDVIYHVAPINWIGTLELYLGPDGYYAHIVTLIGMLVTLTGLLLPRRLSSRHHSQTQHS